MPPPFRVGLAGHVALVTGAGRGIGRSVAQSLAAAGAAVAVVARSSDQLADTVALIRAAGGHAAAFAVDVTDRFAVDAAAHAVADTLGPIDLLVNNAALLEPLGVVWEVDPDDWWRCVEVNLRGPFLCSRAVLPHMIARGSGRIVNVSSGAGNVPVPDASAYTSSKAALTRFTETLAAECREFGIHVFAINPGDVATSMHEHLASSAAWRTRRPSFAPTFVSAERPADLVLRLAAGHADALSGRLIGVDDDLDALVRDTAEIVAQDLRVLRLRR